MHQEFHEGLGNILAVRMILLTWFDHLEGCFSYTEVPLKNFCLPVKTTGSCPPADNVNQLTSGAHGCNSFISCE